MDGERISEDDYRDLMPMITYAKGGNVDGFNLVYETWSESNGGNGIEGTIRTIPQNYYVATIDGEGDISFSYLESQTANVNKEEVKRLWESNSIPKRTNK